MLLSAILLSCSKDDPVLTLNALTATMFAHEEYQITTTNGTNVTFESKNPYVAKVDNMGKVRSLTIGTAIIDVNSDQGKAQVLITVNPKYNTYTEPFRDFTKTKSQITSVYGTPDVETTNGIGYYYDNNNVHIADMYLFTNGILSSSTALINQDYAVDAMQFIGERYLPLDSSDGIYMFVNGTSKDNISIIVALTKMSGYKLYEVIYMPYKGDTRSILELHNKDIKHRISKELELCLEEYKE